MMNRNRAIKLLGMSLFTAGFLWIVFLHFTVDAWTKVSVSKQVSIVRDSEKLSYTKDELERYVMDVIIDRASRVQSPLPLSIIMFFSISIILLSGRPQLKGSST